MNKKYVAVVLAIFLGLTACLKCSGAYAEKVTSSLTVSPPNQKIALIPGEKYKGSIQVFSPAKNEKEMHYSVRVGSFSEHGSESSNDDYGGAVDYIARSSYNQMVDWITLDKTEGTLSPNNTDVITYTIDVPENAPAGGQYASFVVRDETESYSEGKGVAVQNIMQILSIIYAEVAGETREAGEILDNSIPSFLLNGPLQTSSMVKNNGNVHTDAQYTLQVWPLFSDEEICSNEENPDTSLILPETERYHAQSCDKTPAIGIFRVKQTVKIFGETSVVERTVILCPLWLMFIILFIIFVIIMWVFMKIRGRKKREGSKDSAE